MSLLSNAVKHCKDKGKIESFVRIDNSKLLVDIVDGSNGIEPENLKIIKKVLERQDYEIPEDISNFKSMQELGVHWKLCQILIHSMKGKMKVQSSIGDGNYVSLIIPVKNSAFNEIGSRRNEQTNHKDYVSRLIDLSSQINHV